MAIENATPALTTAPANATPAVANATPAPAPAVPIGDRLLEQNSNNGQPLPPTLRREFELKLERNFHAVRVHESHLPTHVNAEAFTTGNNIHFAPGRYDPHSCSGQERLGRELAHIGQPKAGRVNTPQS
jgi:hypothetical protein